MSAGYINHAEIMGYVGQNPKATKLDDGSQVVHVSIGTTDRWADKNTGEEKSVTEWHNVAFFGKVTEVVMKYVTKGSRVLIKGKLKTRKVTKDGIDHYNTGIVVSGGNGELHLLGDRREKSELPEKGSTANEYQYASQGGQY